MKQSRGNRILLTFPIPSFNFLLIINQDINQIVIMEINTPGTRVNMPLMESVDCKTLFAKNKSGFDPHAFVKLKIKYIKSHPTTQT